MEQMRIGLTERARVVGRQVEESVGKTGQGKPLPEPYILLRRDENKDIGEKKFTCYEVYEAIETIWIGGPVNLVTLMS